MVGGSSDESKYTEVFLSESRAIWMTSKRASPPRCFEAPRDTIYEPQFTEDITEIYAVFGQLYSEITP